VLKTPPPIPPFSPKNAKALPLRAKALLLHPKSITSACRTNASASPLASPENTGLPRRLNTPFSLHRPPFFCNFALGK